MFPPALLVLWEVFQEPVLPRHALERSGPVNDQVLDLRQLELSQDPLTYAPHEGHSSASLHAAGQGSIGSHTHLTGGPDVLRAVIIVPDLARDPHILPLHVPLLHRLVDAFPHLVLILVN
jgi:hypothetical protein